MKVSYVNDSMAVMWPEAMEDKTSYDIKQVVADILAIRTAKDVLDFILKTPPSFFSNLVHESLRDWILADDFVGQWSADSRVRGSISDLVEKYYPEIEVLDGFVLKSGELGPYIKDHLLAAPKDDDPVYADVIYPPKPHYSLLVGGLEAIMFNLQTIAKIGAIANGEPSPDGLERVSIECDVAAQVIDSGLSISSDMNRTPSQDPDYSAYFSADEVKELDKALGVDPDNHNEGLTCLYYGKGTGSLFVYPAGMTDQEMAVNIFLSFMNSLFEGDAETMYSGNIFKVEYGRRGFRVLDHPGPLRDAYRQVAYLAANNSIHLCAYCGKPLLADRSRGNEAMYCSRTCNTKASAQRRETAYALAASGVPLEEVIRRIGNRYEQSIRRWYKESKALLD